MTKGVFVLKKNFLTLGCVIGGVSVGYFANKVTTPLGFTLFALGVLLLVISIGFLSKEGKR